MQMLTEHTIAVDSVFEQSFESSMHTGSVIYSQIVKQVQNAVHVMVQYFHGRLRIT